MSPTVPAPAEAPEDSRESHAMLLEATFPSGARQWRCPTCGHQTVIQYPDARRRFKMIVLTEGNEAATHTTGSEGLRIGTAVAAEAPGPGDAFATAKSDGGLLH